MALNGRLPASMLAPIAGGQLRKDAALRWNSMNIARRKKGLSTILPNGPQSSYRTFLGQVAMKAMWTRAGKPQNAATPGTSNHGWGLAVDANNPAGVNASGAPYGWQKKWSDAPWEPWHFKWAGFGIVIRPKYYERTFKRGDKGYAIVRLKRKLATLKYRRRVPAYGEWFDKKTVGHVKKFQRDHGLKADGIVGPVTWRALNRAVKAKKKRGK